MSITETQLTLAEFVAQNGIRMTARRVDSNPLMDDRDMDHWRCTLTCGGRRMSLTFSKGFGHHGERPSVSEVLSCLASDTSCLDEDFDQWCGNYGYDTDSRKAWKTFQACTQQSMKLRVLLGSADTYETLVFHTDRD